MSDGRDFALELNLGYESHYDYVKSLATSSKRIRIHLILFFTDNVELCLLRAKVRHQNGGHLVEPHVIRTMYRDTIPSFKKHSKLFTDVSFISVTDLDIEEVTHRDLPNWVSANNLVHYVRN
ncbi:hypothetical protein [Dyadobacter jiangsuensis]|nr:hypothetical protein [Dyadobacter jiangsuensis]